MAKSAARKDKPTARIVSVRTARARLGQILRRVRDGRERILIERRGQPEAIVMSVEDYINVVAPAPDWLERAWTASAESGADTMSMDEIDAVIADVRRERRTGRGAEAR
jgi:prevent-host-death family protein